MDEAGNSDAVFDVRWHSAWAIIIPPFFAVALLWLALPKSTFTMFETLCFMAMSTALFMGLPAYLYSRYAILLWLARRHGYRQIQHSLKWIWVVNFVVCLALVATRELGDHPNETEFWGGAADAWIPYSLVVVTALMGPGLVFTTLLSWWPPVAITGDSQRMNLKDLGQ